MMLESEQEPESRNNQLPRITGPEALRLATVDFSCWRLASRSSPPLQSPRPPNANGVHRVNGAFDPPYLTSANATSPTTFNDRAESLSIVSPPV